MKYALVSVACAECRFPFRPDGGPALVEVLGQYETVSEVKAAAVPLGYGSDTRWVPHPLGGWAVFDNDGDIWIAPLDAFTRTTPIEERS